MCATHSKMAKRSGPYKRYLESDTERIPRRTKLRWNAKLNYNKNGPRNTGGDRNNTSNSEDEKMDNEHFEKDIQEIDNEDDRVNTDYDMSNASDSEVGNENSPRSSLFCSDILENEEDLSDSEGSMLHASRSEAEKDGDIEDLMEDNTGGGSTSECSVNEEDLSDSEGSMLHASRSEAEKDGDIEDLMEDNTGGGSTSECSVNNEGRADADDKPLYPGAPLSKGESVLMLMSYLLRHNLTGEAFTHLLEMFNIMFPGLIPSSNYLFHKEFGSSSKFEIHFYCESCSKYLGIKADCPVQCDYCNTVFDASANLNNGFFFLVLPLYSQIQQLLQEHSVSLNEKTRTSGVVSDIQSGEEYQKLCDNGVLGKDDLTLIWNCDGAPVFKSSKCSIWPIQCQVIELKPDVRKKHILMSALWFGTSKPSMFTLLTPFVKEASLLETAGIEWKDIHGNCHVSKVYVLVCSSDSVARPLLRNTKQFNGFYGCDFCYHKGGKSYPYDQPEPPLRNERDHFSHAMSASDNEPVFGVKGPSPLMKLSHFQMINGFIPEYQHNVCLGITRQLSRLWFDTANSESAWYIGKQIEEVNLRLVKIKPPVEITRTPRSVIEQKFWKASEWRAFLLFYALPVLKGILPARFWNHLFLLVFGIYTLLQDKIKARSILMAELALKKFVIEFQRLYGTRHMTFNIHLLTHVAQSVKHWGPLWATSTFVFESNMGTLLKYCQGTQFIPTQIARKFLLWRELPEKTKHTITNAKVQSFVEELYTNKRRTEKCEILNERVKGFGHPPLQENITALYRIAISKLCGNLSNCFWSFSRFLVDGVLYHSQKHDRLKKRYNSGVYLKDGTLCLINDLIIFKQLCAHQSPANCACTKHCCVLVEVLAKSSRPLCKDLQINIQSTFTHEVRKTGNVSAIWPDMMIKKCVVVETVDKLYITPLPNDHERD